MLPKLAPDTVLSLIDPISIVLAVIVAVATAYVALDLSNHGYRLKDWGAGWMLASAFVLGAGVWTMHAVALLGIRPPMPVIFDPIRAAVALVVAVLASSTGMIIVVYGRSWRHSVVTGGAICGFGLLMMHHIGMAALQLDGAVWHHGPLTLAALPLSIALGGFGFWYSARPITAWTRFLTGAVLGFGVVGLLFLTLSALVIVPTETAQATGRFILTGQPISQPMVLSTQSTTIAIAVAMLFLLGTVLIACQIDRYRSDMRAVGQTAQHRSVVDTAVDPIVVIDEVGTIQSFNRAAENTFGYSATEVIGQNVSMLMPEPHHSDHDRYLARYRRTRERKIIGIGRAVEGRRRDGSTFPLELSVAEWRDGRRRFYTGIMRDITARKAAEDALRKAMDEAETAREEAELAREEALLAKDAAERADLAKSKFLAAASHDLRQPVQSLFFFGYSLAQSLRDHPAAPLMNSMQEAMNGLLLLLDSLLDVSRLDAGVVTPNLADMALEPMFERLSIEYGPRANEVGLRFRHVPTSLCTYSDPVLLERVLRNFIENALRYTEHGSILTGCRKRGDQIEIMVMDSGIGIPSSQLDNIFEEFTQLANPERDRRKGLGLGLAVVRRLSSLLNHPVKVRSRPGQGSAFSMLVPMIGTHSMSARSQLEVGDYASNRGLVAVVEDEPIILLSIRSMLEDWGYQVVAAPNAVEAVAALSKLNRPPDMIVADYRLRDGKTGLEAIHLIQRHCGEQVSAMVLTGDTDPERIAEVQRSGYQLLHKPISPATLRRALVLAS